MSAAVLAVATFTGPLAAPAYAGYTRLCSGYSACAKAGMSASGYAQANGTMYWLMYSGHNCTNYAAYRMVKSGLANKRPWSGSGNAYNWGRAMRSITDSTPRVGAVAWWDLNVYPAGSVGHVAYVEKVISNSEIIVSQDSWGGDFSWARITKSGAGWPSGFVHFNDVKLTSTLSAPTISGLPKVGTELTANAGTWKPAGTAVAYQWLADGVAVAGATASTFTPTADLIDKALTVRVSATQTGYAKVTQVSAATDPVLPGVLSNEEAPVISGTPVVDGTLKASAGSWNPRPDGFRYQWSADGAAISGATSATLPLGPELQGKKLAVRVAAVRTGYTAVRVTTPKTDPVAPGTLTLDAPPVLSGTPQLGQSLTVSAGTVTPQATATIAWKRGLDTVADATAPSFRLTTTDLGRRFRAQVTYERPGYTPLTVLTGASGYVRSVARLKVDASSPRRGRIKLVATVTAPGVSPVGGIARFRSGGKLLAEVPVVNGVARTTLTDIKSGTRSYRVRYVGTRTTVGTMVSGTVVVR